MVKEFMGMRDILYSVYLYLHELTRIYLYIYCENLRMLPWLPGIITVHTTNWFHQSSKPPYQTAEYYIILLYFHCK